MRFVEGKTSPCLAGLNLAVTPIYHAQQSTNQQPSIKGNYQTVIFRINPSLYNFSPLTDRKLIYKITLLFLTDCFCSSPSDLLQKYINKNERQFKNDLKHF